MNLKWVCCICSRPVFEESKKFKISQELADFPAFSYADNHWKAGNSVGRIDIISEMCYNLVTLLMEKIDDD